MLSMRLTCTSWRYQTQHHQRRRCHWQSLWTRLSLTILSSLPEKTHPMVLSLQTRAAFDQSTVPDQPPATPVQPAQVDWRQRLMDTLGRMLEWLRNNRTNDQHDLNIGNKRFLCKNMSSRVNVCISFVKNWIVIWRICLFSIHEREYILRIIRVVLYYKITIWTYVQGMQLLTIGVCLLICGNEWIQKWKIMFLICVILRVGLSSVHGGVFKAVGEHKGRLVLRHDLAHSSNDMILVRMDNLWRHASRTIPGSTHDWRTNNLHHKSERTGSSQRSFRHQPLGQEPTSQQATTAITSTQQSSQWRLHRRLRQKYKDIWPKWILW